MKREYAPVVVKIGGTVATDPDRLGNLFADLASLESPPVLVHGGGVAVSSLSRRLGLEPRFQDGIRITSPEEMDIADMVLGGSVNTALVRLASHAGIAAVGLTGADAGLLTGRTIGADGSRTARPLRVDPKVVTLLLSAGYLPVVASVATGEDGGAVNVNADDAAQAVAEALPRAVLCYLSDIPGVLDLSGAVIPRIGTSEVESLIGSGVARDGMAAKLRSSAAAVESGVARVVIGTIEAPGDVARLLSGTQGTQIMAALDRGNQ